MKLYVPSVIDLKLPIAISKSLSKVSCFHDFFLKFATPCLQGTCNYTLISIQNLKSFKSLLFIDTKNINFDHVIQKIHLFIIGLSEIPVLKPSNFSDFELKIYHDNEFFSTKIYWFQKIWTFFCRIR